MDQDIESQMDRAKELLQELTESCNSDLHNKTVSDKTKNLTQEILVKMRSVFDQAMYQFFRKNIEPTLSEKEKKKAIVYFPIVSPKGNIKSVLGKAKMSDLDVKHPNIYAYLDSVQSCNKGYEWLEHFSKFSNEKHIRLTPQKKFEQERTTVTNHRGGSVSWTPGSVKFGPGVSIMGAPVDPVTQDIVPTPGVESRKETWVSFGLGDSNINSLWLCEKVVKDGEKIIENFLNLF